MSIIRMSIKRPVTVSMITAGVIAFGLISLLKLPINLLPDLAYPTLTLETRYPGAAPEEVEYLVTRQIEEAVAVIPNLKRVTSASKPELSQVMLEFEWGREMDFAILDVSKKVDLLRLPDDVEKPRILRYDPNQDPIMKVSVTADMPLTQLRFFGEEELKKRLDGVPGIASVKVIGGQEEVIEVHLDESSLKRFGLTIDAVSTRLREENINRAGGSLYENDARYLVRTLNEFRSLEDISETIISREGEKKIYLHEIAAIQYGFKDRDQIARINGAEGIELAFYKEGDANTVQVTRSLQQAVENLQEQFKDKMTITPTFMGASFIENAVNEVKSNAFFGGIIAILVLFFFLRDFKGTLIVGFAIPISVFATFFLMFQFGVSMNIMSLGGLALGIGMLVDNSIVVLESIFVRRAEGDDSKSAAENGASIVSGAVIASTLTTIVVFLPIAFIKGIGGQLFKDLGMTVSFSLLASLVVSLTLMPTLYALFSRKRQNAEKEAGESSQTNPVVVEQPKEGRIFAAYEAVLNLALRYRYVLLIVTVLLIVQGGMLWKKMGINLIPEMSQGDYFVLLELEEGTPIEKTDRIADWVEDRLLDTPGVKVVFTNVGQFNQGVDSRTGENLAQVNFSVEGDAGQIDGTLAQIRTKLNEGPDLHYQVGAPSYFTFKTPIEIEVYDEDRDQLETISQELTTKMNALGLLADVRTTVADGNPEVQINFKRDNMSRMGLSIGTVAQMLRDKIQGTVATRFVKSGRDVDIMVRLEERDRNDLDLLESMTIGYKDGRPIFLSSVAEIVHEIGPAQINRVDQRRCAIVTAGLQDSDLNTAGEALAPILADLNASYPNSHIQLSGQNAEMKESFKSLMYASLLAIFLVYLVMASQFESLFHPFLILFTIPLGLVGGLGALYLAGLEISVIALIGLVMLAGIVVNNAIVLIDYINQLRREGEELYQALIMAGKRRMRPIVMTTTTTVLGLLPMALGLGEGAEMRTPLAITVIGGLLLSTLLTLVIIPVLYGTFSRGLKLPHQQEESVAREVMV